MAIPTIDELADYVYSKSGASVNHCADYFGCNPGDIARVVFSAQDVFLVTYGFESRNGTHTMLKIDPIYRAALDHVSKKYDDLNFGFNENEIGNDPILKFFGYAHLPAHLQAVSKPFCALARHIVDTLPRNAERSVALRKLLEAKDAGVRASLG